MADKPAKTEAKRNPKEVSNTVCAECRAAMPASELPRCAACFAALVDACAANIDRLYIGARQIYIGRTNHPQRRLLEHAIEPARNTNLSVLAWSRDWREVAVLEEALVARFSGRGKATNIDRASDGRFRAEWNCLYCNWAPKNGFALSKENPIQEVDRLISAPARHNADLWRGVPEQFVLGESLKQSSRPSAGVAVAAVQAELARWAARPPYKARVGGKPSKGDFGLPPREVPESKPAKEPKLWYHAFQFNMPDAAPHLSARSLRGLHEAIFADGSEHDMIKRGVAGALLKECASLTDDEKAKLNLFCGPDEAYG